MNNEIFYQGEGYYLSYNPACFDTGLPETAIVVDNPEKKGIPYNFYILNGDHRFIYKTIESNLQNCLKYFDENRDKMSYSSDTLIEIIKD